MNKMIKVWTIQSLEAWQELQQTGVLYGNQKFINLDFINSYNWILQQMQKRLNNFSGNYPIWVWIKPKPDLRHTGYVTKGRKAVRLELLISEDRILKSDYDAWHCVLNEWYLSLTDKESDMFDYELERREIKYPLFLKKLPDDLKQQVIDSWERIFDLDLIKNTEWCSTKQYIQGVVDGIYLNDVVSIKEFIGR
jgi:hypothetical protein